MIRFSEFVYKYRIYLILLSWLIALLGVSQIPKTKINPEVEAMIPDNMESRVMTDSIESIFGGSNMVIIVIENEDVLSKATLLRLRSISGELAQLDDIQSLISPFNSHRIRGDEGMMLVEPAIPFIPESIAERDSLQSIIEANPLIMGVCFSENFRYAAIIGTLKRGTDNTGLLHNIRQVINNNPGKEIIHLGGIPVVNEAITDNIAKDLWYILPLALALMTLILLLAFRTYLGLILPFSIVIMSVAISMGLIPIMGWSVTIVTVLLPVMLIAIANNYGIHLLNKDIEIENANPTIQRAQRIRELWKSIGKPVILTGLTTIAGVLGLISHIIIPARQVGLLAAIGISWALIISLIYIPAWLSGKRKIYTSSRKGYSIISRTDRWLSFIAKTISRRPGRILLISGLIVVFISMGMARLIVDGNTVNFFNKKHEVRLTSELIDHQFGGSQSILVQFSGNIKDPEVLHKMDYCSMELKKQPGVGSVTSICDVIKVMSKALLDPGDEGYGEIPNSQAAVSQFFELYSFSSDPADFEQLVDFNYENALMIIRINDGSALSVMGVKDKIEEIIGNDQILSRIGGVALITTELTNSLIKGQKRSLIWALFIVVVLIMIIFKSVKTGLLALVPLAMACLILFGSMGWLGIPLDAATALLSSVMIGVGVDYTIHYLWRHSQELKNGSNHQEAILTTLKTTGKGIFFNAMTVMLGFSVLLISSFNPIRFFGFLTVLSILACLIGALVIVPAIVMLIKPKFLNK